MSESEKTYTPINCSIYDQIEIFAMRKTPVELIVNQEGAEVKLEGLIVDINALKEGEFLTMASGQEIRLDRVISLKKRQ